MSNKTYKICSRVLIDHGKSVWMEEKDFYQDIVIATSGSFAYKRKVSLSYHVKKDKHFYSKPSTQAKKQSSDAREDNSKDSRFGLDIDELFQLKKNGMLVESYYIGGPRYRR